MSGPHIASKRPALHLAAPVQLAGNHDSRGSAFFGRAFTVSDAAGIERTFCDRAASEPLTAVDQRNLRRAIWSVASRVQYEGAWTQAIWRALRLACGCPSPMPLQACHRPIIAAEDLAWMAARLVDDEAKWLAKAEADLAALEGWPFEDINRFERADGCCPLEHAECAEDLGGAQ